MLNEQREFEEYSCPIPDPDAFGNSVWEGKRDTYCYDALDKVPQRLRFDKITDKLSGIRRALTIIARHALQGDPARLDFARDCLRLWCGFAPEKALNLSDPKDAALAQRLDGWLPRYLRLLRAYKLDDVLAVLAVLKNLWTGKEAAECGWDAEPAQIKLDGWITAEEIDALWETIRPLYLPGEKPPVSVVKPLRAECDRILKEKESTLNEALHTVLQKRLDELIDKVKTAERPNDMLRRLAGRRKDYQSRALELEEESESDLYAVTFDAILADALDQGPLRNLALVSSRCAARETLYDGVWMNKKKMDMTYEHFDEWEKQLMKLTAMVLLARRPGAETGYPVPFSLTEADNYLQTDVKKKSVCQRFAIGESEKTRRPIFTLAQLSSGLRTLNMSDEWLRRGGWELAERSGLPEDRLYFTDEEGMHIVPGEAEA